MRRANPSSRWVPGNRFELLENGEEFFPRVFEAIAQARREVMLETFILFDDKIGQQLHAALLQAARRGVDVHVLVDGFGSPDLSERFIGELVEAGVHFRIFDPGGKRIFGQRLNMLRRMHRKIVVIDGERGFIGGINYSADHVADFGLEAKQDYSVEVRGPIVAQMHHFTHEAVLPRGQRHRGRTRPATGLPYAGTSHAMFVTRDNHNHTNDIERHYRIALRSARKRVVIANAYFFPGYRFIREMRRAARRGVEVRLILQGQPDMPIVKTAASLLYDHLLRAGVRIYEYCDRPLHGKVALVDDEWSTVGSSNLDPLSLSLNLEANVIIRDSEFNATLYKRLAHLMEHSCRQVEPAPQGAWEGLRLLRSYCVFHLMRWFPTWVGWLPRHKPQISLVSAPERVMDASPGTPQTSGPHCRGARSAAPMAGPSTHGNALEPPQGPGSAAHPPGSGPAAAHRRSPHARQSTWRRLRSQRWWPWLATGLSVAFIVFIGYLLLHQARQVEWSAVWTAFLALPPAVVGAAAAFAWGSHLIYSSFDLFGRHYTRHGLSVARTVGITLIAYPFTLNLGSLIGGVSVRYRLYSRQGIGVARIGQIVALSILTNWLGYFLLAGAVFWAWTPQLPPGWQVSSGQLRAIGTALPALTVAYVGLCAWRRGRPVAVRRHRFALPHWGTGLLQVAVSTVNWMAMGAALWMLTQQQAPYAATLATVLLGAIAGLISRIPAGLGVLEAVGTAVLSAYMPASQALAAILAYRALYFFAPLVVAALAFGATELFWRRRRAD